MWYPHSNEPENENENDLKGWDMDAGGIPHNGVHPWLQVQGMSLCDLPMIRQCLNSVSGMQISAHLSLQVSGKKECKRPMAKGIRHMSPI